MNNLKKILILFLLFSNLIYGQGFFQLANHAKTASGWGMGTAISSLNNNIDGVFQNPATLSNAPNFVHINHTNFVLDINTTNLSVGFDNNYFDYAIGISYMNFGKFDKLDKNGQELGEFSANDKEINMVLSKKLGNYLSAGFSLSYLHSTIDNFSSSALKNDIGLQYFNSNNQLAISLVYKNLDYAISSYSQKTENLSNLFLLGISKQLKYLPATVSVDCLKYADYNLLINLGAKFQFGQYLTLLTGTSSRKFDLQNRTDISSLFSGISAGIGLQIASYNFGLSYNSLGDAGEITSYSMTKILD